MVFMAICTQEILEVINVCKVKVLNLQGKDYKHFCSGILAMNEKGRLWSQPKTSIYTQFLRILILKNKVLKSKKPDWQGWR